MQIRSVGIDLGKTTFHVVALNAAGKVLLRKKFTQKQLITFTANMQTSLIGMEACSGARTSSDVCCANKASAVLRVKRERSPFGPWLNALERRSPVKVVITAAANKLARIAWAVLSSGQDYRAVPDAITA